MRKADSADTRPAVLWCLLKEKAEQSGLEGEEKASMGRTHPGLTCVFKHTNSESSTNIVLCRARMICQFSRDIGHLSDDSHISNYTANVSRFRNL